MVTVMGVVAGIDNADSQQVQVCIEIVGFASDTTKLFWLLYEYVRVRTKEDSALRIMRRKSVVQQ